MKSLLAIADTHLGLSSRKVNCEPVHLKDFLDWVRSLESEEDGTEVQSKISPQVGRKIRPPDHLLVLGDAIELWDADARSIYLCSKAVLEALNRLKSNVIYLVGNHDYLVGKKKGSYPLLNSRLEILSDTYPEQMDEAVINTLPKGDRSYLFLHGHQFDLSFRRLGWGAMIMGYLRDGAVAFGNYSWMTLLFFFAFLAGYIINKLVYIPPSFTIDLQYFVWPVDMSLIRNSFLWGMITMVMGVFSLPRLLVSVARPIWNRIKHTRYNRERALDGFLDWWNGFSKKRRCDARTLNIVYGHTHILDFIPIEQAYTIAGRSLKRSKVAPSIRLTNIPAWVHDAGQPDVIKDVILYIDDEGYEFLAWDSEEKRPYLVPKSTVEKISYQQTLSREELSYVRELSKR